MAWPPEDTPAGSAARTAVAEVAWRSPDGGLDGTVAVPFALHRAPALALTYAQRDLADAIAASRRTVMVCSESRCALRGWSPCGVVGRARLIEDLDGSIFESELLAEEIRKHPPARLLADSLMQRREHWWYLPRLLVTWPDAERLPAPAARGGGDTGTLVWEAGHDLGADTVDVLDEPDAHRVRVRSLAGRDLPDGAVSALLLRHDFSVPDLELTARARLWGRLADGELEVIDRDGATELGPPPSLMARWRERRRLERACRRGIQAAEARG